MASAKAIQISKDIDVARCNGNWAVIPELARRYKKYYSEGAGEWARFFDAAERVDG